MQSSGWESTGGDPGGYLHWVDAASGEDSYYQAPKAFLGTKAAFYGGTLSYAILDTGNGLTAYDVQLAGGGHTLQFTNPGDAGFPTPNTWSDASVALVAANFIDTATGAAPSRSEMRDVLHHLTALDIRAEYVTGAETGGLDNVILAPAAAPFPSTGGRADPHHDLGASIGNVLPHIS